ncbi:MAG: hypothetical protein M3O80_01610 [Chloroflexota bacterium]|nr:hypothetical protein [Chloroflexota bacterium]
MRGTLLTLFVVVGLGLGPHSGVATSCGRESATAIQQRGDVAATGTVESIVPLGFIFAADGVYKGDVPAHVLVLGQYRPSEVVGIRFFAVMRFHLSGVYSMDICDGRPLTNPDLGPLGEARSPSSDLPIGQAAIVMVGALLAVLLLRRGRGKPRTPAAASAY